jgi:hypothetical protein
MMSGGTVVTRFVRTPRAGLILAALVLAAAAGAFAAIATDPAASEPSEPGVAAHIAELGSVTTPEQAAAFADGVITREERTAARDATIACLEDAGITVTRTGDSFTFGGATTREGNQADSAPYNACYQRFEREIDIAYGRQGASAGRQG